MELRKDYILNRWVIISLSREKRPSEFKRIATPLQVQTCIFCPHNEHLTPPETSRLEVDGRWKTRTFENLFAAVDEAKFQSVQVHNKYFTFSSAYGKHEVLVETPEHGKELADLPVEDIKWVLETYKNRIEALYQHQGVEYVCVFKNSGFEAGTSIQHAHSQIIAYNIIPELIREEMDASSRLGSCSYCEILNIEKGSYRRCFENNTFVAFTPYASRFHFEIWVFPKQHITSIRQLNDAQVGDLADILKKILLRLKSLSASYNICLHESPRDGHLHFHLEILPRLATWAGFEYATDTCINTISPETAASFYRGEL